MRGVLPGDQLRDDPHTVAAAAHAALQNVAHAQFRAHLPDADRVMPVGEAGVPGDYQQRAVARQLSDDLIGQPVGEILLLRIAAQVGERQDGDRPPAR